MSRKKAGMNWILIVLCAVSFAGHLAVFPGLPEQIPIHWNAEGEIDNYGPRVMDLVLGALPLLICILMYVMPVLDPRRRNYERHKKVYGIMTALISVMMMGFSWLSTLAALGYDPDMARILPVVVGVLFIILGNYMPKLQSNYFVGVRTPWAIENTWVWRKTQWMGGITFIIMGAVFLVSVFLPSGFQAPVLISVVLGGVVWDYLYSWLVYRRARRMGKLGQEENE